MSIIKPKFFWPLTIDSSNKGLAIYNGSTVVTFNIAEGTYLGPASLASAIQAAAIVAGFSNMLVAISELGYVTFTNTSGVAFELRCGNIAFTIYPYIGFSAITYASTAGPGGVHLVTSPNQHWNGWYPNIPPRADSLKQRDRSNHVVTRAMDGTTRHISQPEVTERVFTFAWLEPERTYSDFETSTTARQSFERMFVDGFARVRYFPNALNDNTPLDYVFAPESMQMFEPKRMFTQKALYELELRLWGYIA